MTTFSGEALLSGAGTLNADSIAHLSGAGLLTGSGVISVPGGVIWTGISAALPGSSSLGVTYWMLHTWQAKALAPGKGSLGVTVVENVQASAHLSG